VVLFSCPLGVVFAASVGADPLAASEDDVAGTPLELVRAQLGGKDEAVPSFL
jgi:hypothetical protein